MLCLRILQAALVYVNTLMLQEVLDEPTWLDQLTPADRRGLTPLFWTHIRAYGEVRLDTLQNTQTPTRQNLKPSIHGRSGHVREYWADLVRTDRHNHRPVATDSQAVDGIKVLARSHQNLIWARTRHLNQLRHGPRVYFPATLEAFDELAGRDGQRYWGELPTRPRRPD